MKVEQYVMAYGIEQDRVRAILPEGFVSLRPVSMQKSVMKKMDMWNLTLPLKKMERKAG